MTTGVFPPDIIVAAQASQAKWQIPASLTLSQWALESNYGAAMPKGSNNPFGIKALPGQSSVSASTGEQTSSGAGYTIVAGFRAFATIADAFDAHGRLLGLGRPYRAMVTTFLQSPRAPADVQRLSNALTDVYATAANYGSALINIQVRYNLYQYDTAKEKPVTDPVAPSTPPASTPAPTKTPTVGQSIQVDWGSWIAQLLVHETPMIEAAGEAAYTAFAPAIIKMFIGPSVIGQYIDQALTALENVINAQNLQVSDSNVVASTVASLINKNEAALANFLGTNLEPMIMAALKKLGLPVA